MILLRLLIIGIFYVACLAVAAGLLLCIGIPEDGAPLLIGGIVVCALCWYAMGKIDDIT